MLSLEEAITIFKQLQNRQPSRWQKIFMFSYLGVGLLALSAEVLYWINHGEPGMLFLLVGIPYMALWFLFRAELINDRRCAGRMINALEGRDQRLTWIYIEEESGARESVRLHYCFTDRQHSEFISNEKTISDLFNFLSSWFTDIGTGYTPELAKQYRRNPGSRREIPKRGRARKQTLVDTDAASNGW